MPRSYTCRACGKPGHNRRQCPKIGGERPRRQAAKREEYFSPRSPNVHVAGAPKARGKTARSRGAEPRNISPNPAQSEAIVGALRAGMKNLVGGLVGMLESWRKDGDKIREEIIARMAALDEERSALVAAMDFLARLKAGPGHEISAVGAENWRVVQDRFDQGVAASEPKAKPDAQAAPHDKSARVLAALNKRGASSVKQIAAATKLDEKAVRYALWRLRAKHFVFCAGARDDARWAVSKKEAKAANAVAVAARRASAG